MHAPKAASCRQMVQLQRHANLGTALVAMQWCCAIELDVGVLAFAAGGEDFCCKKRPLLVFRLEGKEGMDYESSHRAQAARLMET